MRNQIAIATALLTFTLHAFAGASSTTLLNRPVMPCVPDCFVGAQTEEVAMTLAASNPGSNVVTHRSIEAFTAAVEPTYDATWFAGLGLHAGLLPSPWAPPYPSLQIATADASPLWVIEHAPGNTWVTTAWPIDLRVGPNPLSGHWNSALGGFFFATDVHSVLLPGAVLQVDLIASASGEVLARETVLSPTVQTFIGFTVQVAPQPLSIVARVLNEDVAVTGYATVSHFFTGQTVAAPVPEPHMTALWLLGLGVLAMSRYKAAVGPARC